MSLEPLRIRDEPEIDALGVAGRDLDLALGVGQETEEIPEDILAELVEAEEHIADALACAWLSRY